MGFSISIINPDSGSCRSESDLEISFTAMQELPGDFISARLIDILYCSALTNAVPAAINTNTPLLVGIATDSDTQYQTEKNVLLATLHKYEQHGFDWLLGVSVGSEDAHLNVASTHKFRPILLDFCSGYAIGLGRLQAYSR
jgi:exo-beta-1,3-glucanase (GH17 family)